MNIWQDPPTKALLAEVIRSHIAGSVVVGIDTCPTGTGKTTSASEFFRELEHFLLTISNTSPFKVVIVASQHRYLGNYWAPGSHQRVIRFLGAEEYGRRVREIFDTTAEPASKEDRMVREGLIPHSCPLRGDKDWQRGISGVSEHRKISIADFRNICRSHLNHRLAFTAPDTLLEPCNHACPLAGGSFFGAVPPTAKKDSSPAPKGNSDRPRIALLTTAKLRYRAAAFYMDDGELKVRTADFQEMRGALFYFEEAADAFATMLGHIDETSVSTELLSTAAVAHSLFSRRSAENGWVRSFYEKASSIYLGATKDTICQDGQWVPVNLYQEDAAQRADYLLPVSRDRCSMVMADFPRYMTHKKKKPNGVQQCFALHIKGRGSPEIPFPEQVVKPARYAKPARTVSSSRNNVIPIASSLNSFVRAVFSRTIKLFVEYFHWTYRPKKGFLFREHIGLELNETFQLHATVKQNLLDLALSEIDYQSNVKSIRDRAQDVFAEDYYYKHGIAYCEVHRQHDATEREPLQLTLNISNPPPELLLYKLLRSRNSIIVSSASIRMPSPYTNIGLEWVLRKHLGELAQIDPQVPHEIISLDDPARPELHRRKMKAISNLFEVRRWEERPLEVDIFRVNSKHPNDDCEYLDGYDEIVRQIGALKERSVPVIGIVMVNSYEHAKELLVRFQHSQAELRIGELYGIGTDANRPGLSVLETWVTKGTVHRSANGSPTPARESMLFDEIENAISSKMGPLLAQTKPQNGLVISVLKKIGKGASLRVNLTNIKLSRCGRAYLGEGVDISPDNPFVDFNLVAFAEHPRNLVNASNYRRIAVQSVSIGGREMQEKLTQQLRYGDYRAIQVAMKWSQFGALGVTDWTVQGAGRITRCRTPLPAHRRLIMSDKQARLAMLGLAYCGPGDLLTTPDLERIREKCADYWDSAAVICNDEDAGAAEWASSVYKSGSERRVIPPASALKAIRDIRTFLCRPENHVLLADSFDKQTAAAFKNDYGRAKEDIAVRNYALGKLRQSYMTATPEQLEHARVSRRTNEVILNHGGRRVSIIAYRQRLPTRRSQKTVMLLKPRELCELAYPAADEAAILDVLEGLHARNAVDFEVQSAISHESFMRPIHDGTHEAGDFFVKIRDINILLDAKTAAVRSLHNPELRDVGSIRAEVLSKTTRFEKGTGIKIDAFVFASSGWKLQKMWYPDEVPRCRIAVFHMDACTTLSRARMAVEFERTLGDIVTHAEWQRSEQRKAK